MPTVSAAPRLALQALIDELGALQPDQIARITTPRNGRNGGVAEARAAALEALAVANRLGQLDAATERLAEACIRDEVPQPVRSAAYDALVAVMASDLVRPATFRTLFGLWDEATGGLVTVDDGEELLLHMG
jgi:hypothetical protein